MKTTNLKTQITKEKLNKHIKIILFCAVFTPLWGLVLKLTHKPDFAILNFDFLFGTFFMMLADIEIILLISVKTFRLRDNLNRKELTRIFLTRMVFFLFFSIITCLIVFITYIIASHLVKGYSLSGLMNIGMLEVIAFVAGITTIGILLSVPLMFFTQWQEALKRESNLREQNLIFQNETLKNQVNPHFLFNSLNTLSSLINTQNEVAEKFIGRLSSIYRYILENSTKDRIPLKEELAFIQDYFYLHQIRDDNKIQLIINIKDGNFHEILPVSLQSLIENAIKHNMATYENPLKILVYLESSYIVVRNNLQKKATQLATTKTGLKNLTERVRLITAKELIIEETTNEFIVKVPLIQ